MVRTIAVFAALTFAVLSQSAHSNGVLVEETISVSDANKKHSELNSLLLDELLPAGASLNFSDITVLHPVASMIDDGRRSELVIRGIGFTGGAFNPGVRSSTVLFIDGVYVPSVSFVSGQVGEMERVEFLAGYSEQRGSITSPVGAVYVSTPQPTFDGLHGSVELGSGSNGEESARATVNWSVNDSNALRIAGYIRRSDGEYTNVFTRNAVNRIDVAGGSLKFRSSYGRNEFSLSTHYVVDKSDWVGAGQAQVYKFNEGQQAFFNNLVPLAYRLVGQERLDFESIYLPDELEEGFVATDFSSDSRAERVISTLRWGFSSNGLELKSQLSYVRSKDAHIIDADSTNLRLGNQGIRDGVEVMALEAEAAAEIGSFNGSIGFRYDIENVSAGRTNYNGSDLWVLRTLIADNQTQRDYFLSLCNCLGQEPSGLEAPVASESTLKTKEYSVFGELEWLYAENMKWRIGGSASKAVQKLSRRQDGFCGYDTVELGTDRCEPTETLILDKFFYEGNISDRDSLYSGFLAHHWAISSNVDMALSSFIHTKPGGFDLLRSIGVGAGYAQTINDLHYKRERSRGLDFSLDYRVREDTEFQAKIYALEISDYQLAYHDGTQFYATNAESVLSKGVSLFLKSNIGEKWRWRSSLHYNKAVYDENSDAACPPTEYRALENCSYQTLQDAVNANDRLYSDLSGVDIRANPRWRGAAMISYNDSLSFNVKYSAGVQMVVKSGARSTEFDNGAFKYSGTSYANAYLSLSWGDLTLSLTGRNLLNERTKILEYPSPLVRAISSIPGGMGVYTQQGRSWAINIDWVL